MNRRDTLALGATLAMPALGSPSDAAAAASSSYESRPRPHVMRYSFRIAETGFDPAKISDLYSRTITAHIFEALYGYDHLALPPKIVPLTAAAMPEVSADFKIWTIRVKPGIFYTPDPAFKGKPRELVAADYLYAIKRFADPANNSPNWSTLEEMQITGLGDVRQRAIDTRKPFDYDAPVDGLRSLDRYTLQIRLGKTIPRALLENLAVSDLFGGIAREVVEHYGEDIAAHPVGTGPFRLSEWRRSSLIVLERNPHYRERLWHAEPAADDAEGQALAARLRGRRLPLLERVEVSIIEQNQPRWLSFIGGEAEFMERVPENFIDFAMPGGEVAPNLAKRGIRGVQTLVADVLVSYFNWEDPVVGGNEPAKVALRRAICLGVDIEREIRLVRHGMAIPAQSPILPYTSGYDPKFKSEMSEYSVPRAKALLDLYGYVDRNGDGWREQPDGQPLTLVYAATSGALDPQLTALWQRNMTAIGIKIVFKIAQWPELLKAALNGKLMMWGVAESGSGGDGQSVLPLYYGPQAGQGNLARFKLPAFDAIYDKLSVLPDGPERLALFDEAKRIAVAYAPYKLHCHRFVADMMQPGLIGYRRPLYWNEWWHMVDYDPGLDPSAA